MNLLIYIIVPLIISSFAVVFIYNLDFRENSGEYSQEELILTPIVGINIQQVNMNYMIFASNQKEYDVWKNTYNIITEYPNLLALEIIISQEDYNHIIRNRLTKPIPSERFRNKLTSLPLIEESVGLSLHSVNDADLLKVSDLWDLGYNGTGVVVAVFDNGINFDHVSLQGQNFTSPQLFNSENGLTEDPCKAHGTPVAGLIASTGAGGYSSYIGTAFGSKLVSMEMGCGTGDRTGDLIGDPIAGFEWLATQNETIRIVNLSWGGSNGLVFQPIINRLSELGIIVVVSAGNVVSSEQSTKFRVNDPATAISSIAVGAVDYGIKPVYFSATGPSPNYIHKPDLVAPGLSVQSTVKSGGYSPFSGTSFSAPIVSGAIATLISGLEAQNIPWNVGTIKAALMRTATPIAADELKVGQGLVNLNATWNYLSNAIQDEQGPRVLEITPSSGPYELFQSFPKGVQANIPISLISSHPDLVTIEITGTLSNILSFDNNLSDDFSQLVQLNVDTTNIAEGIYSGFVNASIQDDFVLSSFSITVEGEVKNRVLIDLRHTNRDLNRDDVLDGFNIGEMAKLAQANEMWLHEVNEEITPQLLSNFEIVWMPDPFNLHQGEFNNPERLISSEIEALTEFVNDGGSMFIDFNGPSSNLYGTNSSELNSLIDQFDIKASSNSDTFSISESANIHNVSSMALGVEDITHYGNYLEVGPKAQIIASDQIGNVVASFQNENGGKVVVSSTNFWLDNTGARGLYVDEGGEGDKILSNNLWEWFTNNDTIKIIADRSSLNEINIDFKVHTKDNNFTPELKVTWSESGYEREYPISVSNLSELLSLNVEVAKDGKYEILIEYGNEYQRLFFIIDTTAPKIQSLQINQTGFEQSLEQTLLFQLVDNLSNLTISNVRVHLDDLELHNISYSETTSLLNISISGLLLTQANHWYTLKINVTDNSLNSNLMLYVFYVGDKPTESYSESSTLISSSESIITADSSSSLLDKKGSSGFIVLSLPMISISLTALSISYRLRKRSD